MSTAASNAQDRVYSGDRPVSFAPQDLIAKFMSAFEAGQVEEAQEMMSPHCRMIFPGGNEFESLSAFQAWSKRRYRAVRKTILATETVETSHIDVVYLHGTLSGEWLNGTPFQNIRFIDRFEIADGKIARQEVWNDIGESLAK